MNRQKFQFIPLFIFLLIVSGALLVSDRNRITDPVRSRVEQVMLKLRGVSTAPDINIEELQSKITSLENERDDLQSENTDLRNQLQAPLPPSYKFIPANILSRTITEQEAQLLISAGSENGVVEGMPVVAEHILIGTIAAVTPRTAHVQLLADPGSAIAVKSAHGARGIVFGNEAVAKSSQALLDRVLLSEPLAAGDVLETSGEDELPENLLIGSVSELMTESRDPFQKARVDLTVNPEILERVFVVSRE